MHIFLKSNLISQWVECSPLLRETKIQSQVESIPPCLTFSIIRYVSRIKWSNPGKGVALSPTPRYSSYRKGSLLVALDSSHQLTYYDTIKMDIIWSYLIFQLSNNNRKKKKGKFWKQIMLQ